MKTLIKTLIRMKSTKMGKDDDTPVTIRYNEGGEYQIGPELLAVFKQLDCVEKIKEKKKESAKKETIKDDLTPGPYHPSNNLPNEYSNQDYPEKDDDISEKEPTGESHKAPKKKKGGKKKNK